MWNPLAGMSKIAIAGTIAGGILVSGIVWQGEPAIQNIQNSIESLKAKAVSSMAEVEFLRNQFTGLKAEYDKNNAEANMTIQELKAQRLALQTQVNDLATQIELDATTDEGAKAEIQAEINRLEGELDKANQQIFALESYAQQKDAEVVYTPLNQADYQFTPVDIESSRSWTEGANLSTAYNYTEDNLNVMRNEDNLLAMEQAYTNMGRNITIVGITTHVHTDGKTYLAYIVQPDNSNLNGFTAEINNVIKSMSATDVMFFINESGELVGSVYEQ